MEYETTDYVKVPIRQFPAREIRETAEGRYWKQFTKPLTAKQVGAVSCIDFSPALPYDFAITSSTRVLIYNGATRTVRRTITRFQDRAYGAHFRSDGRVLAAGGESGMVQIFDAASRSILRQLKGHSRPAHGAYFSSDRVHVLSVGDDATARWWDVTAGTQVGRLSGHEDYVRSAAAHPTSAEVWATGCYDHGVRLWDMRSQSSVLKVDHGAPVEAVAFVPSGSLLITAGGTNVCIWDVLSGGRLLAQLSNHQKTVTCLAVSPSAGPASAVAPRLLTGSLDGHLKVYELEGFQVTHVQSHVAPILSLGLAPDNSLLAVGMADGTLSVRRHRQATRRGNGAPAPVDASGEYARVSRGPKPLTAASYRYFVRGQSTRAAEDDFVVAAQRAARLAPYDRLLRRFRYREALEAALETGGPQVVSSLLEELAARAGVQAAVERLEGPARLALARMVRRNVSDPRFACQFVGIAAGLLEGGGFSVADAEQRRGVSKLRDAVRDELDTQGELLRVKGMLETLLSSGLGGAGQEVAVKS